ncbi:unnamed protein product, partial [Didymodactylos carnosus]
INAQEVGVIGAIIMDNDKDNKQAVIDMLDDQTTRNVKIPVMFITYDDGHMILQSIKRNNFIGALINIPLNLSHTDVFKARKAPWSYWL